MRFGGYFFERLFSGFADLCLASLPALDTASYLPVNVFEILVDSNGQA